MDQEPQQNAADRILPPRSPETRPGGLACAACGGAGHLLRRRAAPVGGLGRRVQGDAPAGKLWELWQKQGWVREARHYLKLGRNIQCKLCPNECLLEPEDRGHCRNRVHKDGKLYTLAYADPCALHVDPIEKKPLLHFLPGTAVFSLATAGCGFRCLNCQNWDISQRKPEETKDPRGEPMRLDVLAVAIAWTATTPSTLTMLPEDVVDAGRVLRLPLDRLHLLRADRLVRVHDRHGQGRPGEEDQELLDHLRLHPGGAAGGVVQGDRRGQRQPQELQRGNLPRPEHGQAGADPGHAEDA